MMPADKIEAKTLEKQIADRQRAIYKMFQVPMGNDIMPPAPGAGSPGGTTRMRFDAQGNPIK